MAEKLKHGAMRGFYAGQHLGYKPKAKARDKARDKRAALPKRGGYR